MVHADKRAVLGRMVELVAQGREALYAGDIETLGRLLHQSWLWKRELATNISSGEIDAIYERALEHGALGGKVLGAGGGGFLLLDVREEQAGRRCGKPCHRCARFTSISRTQGSQVIYFCDETGGPSDGTPG